MSTEIDNAVVEAEAIAGQADEESTAVLASTQAFAITTDAQYEEGAELLKAIKAKRTELDSVRQSITRPIDQAKARVLALFKPASERLAKAESAIKDAMLSFTAAQERQRREEQAKLDEAARKQRQHLADLADKQRARGDERQAEATEARAVAVPDVTVVVEPPKVAGVVTRTTWKAQVDDLYMLIQAVATGEAPLSFILPNMPDLNAAARLQKVAFSVPGVRAVAEEGIAARGAS